jgi:hypothetical protein
MIDLKNRTREARVYQYPDSVNAGPVRPKRQTVYRSEHNPRNGNVTRRERSVLLGGSLSLPPRGEVKGLPDALLNHPTLQRDIKSRAVRVVHHKEPVKPKPKAKAAAPKSKKSSKRSRR